MFDANGQPLLSVAGEARGERIIPEELARLGWQEGELTARCKNDADKLAIAARVRLGTSKSGNARVHQAMRETTQAQDS